MTMTWKTGDASVARQANPPTVHSAEPSDGDEGFSVEIDLAVDPDNDDTVIMGPAKAKTPLVRMSRLVIPGRESAEHDRRDSDRIKTLKQKFDESSYRELQQVCITEDGNSICLSGRVPSYFLKQTAQEIVRQQEANQQIVNAIEVV